MVARVGIAVGLLMACLFPWSASGHGDAAWIMQNPQFTDSDGIHCCGPRDCTVAPKGALVEVQGGVMVAETGQMLWNGQKGLYTSIDENWWWCVRGEVKCVFRPLVGA